MLEALILFASAYLYGSLPLVYLLGRGRGVDLRGVGSRNVGGGNLWQRVGPGEGLGGGLFDVSKGLFPAWIAQILGLEQGTVVMAGLGGVIGQSWPLLLRFGGGRGISASLGASLVFAPKELGLAVVPMAISAALHGVPLWQRSRGLPLRERLRLDGPYSKSVPLGVAIGLALMPFLSWFFAESSAVVLGTAALLALMVIRRLTAGLRQDWSRYPDRRIMLLSRLLYDRSQP